jgi:hypothetical protein
MIIAEIRALRQEKSDLRKFGITMGVALMLLGGFLWWRAIDWYGYLFIGAGVFILLGLAIPITLKPVHTAWMAFAFVLGWVMTRVILTVLFYLVVTPTGWLGKVFGERFLDVKIDPGASSYWIHRERPRGSKSDYEKQF